MSLTRRFQPLPLPPTFRRDSSLPGQRRWQISIRPAPTSNSCSGSQASASGMRGRAPVST